MANSTTFGFVKAWAKEPKDESGFKTYADEYVVPDGILMSGKIDIKPDMVDALIEYLQDPTNADQYGHHLDFALFYSSDKSVAIQGKMTTPYKAGDNVKGTQSAPASTRARRTV
jgi:hypothetical protein